MYRDFFRNYIIVQRVSNEHNIRRINLSIIIYILLGFARALLIKFKKSVDKIVQSPHALDTNTPCVEASFWSLRLDSRIDLIPKSIIHSLNCMGFNKMKDTEAGVDASLWIPLLFSKSWVYEIWKFMLFFVFIHMLFDLKIQF
jgi:hypothetical protein